VERFSFRFLEPLLRERYTLCAVDRRGRGESGDSTGDYAIEHEFADVAAVVASFAEPVDLFGHSFGATVALGAAPVATNLRRLILYEPAPGVRQVEPELLTQLDALLAADHHEQLLSTFLTEVGVDSDALAQLRASPIWAPRVAAAHTIPRELRAEEAYRPTLEAFSTFAIPTLLLVGSESPAWAKTGTEVARSVLTDSQVAELDGEGHFAILSGPELVAAEVSGFLGE
jgi:pimeloyl-ACP methyl ester carboxylesterase